MHLKCIPYDACAFGAESLNDAPVAYGKSKISGNTKATYILHSKGGCMPGQQDIFTPNARTKPDDHDPIDDNKIIKAFQREQNNKLHKPCSSKYAKLSADSFTYDAYFPHDDESLNIAIQAAYRQLYGNYFPMESERPIELERRLRNGDIPIREFIRQLAKSTFYRLHFFELVSQQRFIELNFKHILGRPPLNQNEIAKHIKLLSDSGFDYQIDHLIDSDEYDEAFGAHIVPYQRCWDSPLGSTTSSFVKIAKLTKSFATSDNAKSTSNCYGGKSLLIQELANEKYKKIEQLS